MDSCFYYLRKKKKYNENRIEQKFTTTDSHFVNYIVNAWKDFVKGNGIIDWTKHGACRTYILGGRLPCSWPWVDVTYIYMPLCVKELDHWVLLVLDLPKRIITIYDSMRGPGYHDDQVIAKVAPIANFLPQALESIGVFDGIPGVEKGTKPFEVVHCMDNPQQENG